MKGATVKIEYPADYELEQNVDFGLDLEEEFDDRTLDAKLIHE